MIMGMEMSVLYRGRGNRSPNEHTVAPRSSSELLAKIQPRLLSADKVTVQELSRYLQQEQPEDLQQQQILDALNTNMYQEFENFEQAIIGTLTSKEIARAHAYHQSMISPRQLQAIQQLLEMQENTADAQHVHNAVCNHLAQTVPSRLLAYDMGKGTFYGDPGYASYHTLGPVTNNRWASKLQDLWSHRQLLQAKAVIPHSAYANADEQQFAAHAELLACQQHAVMHMLDSQGVPLPAIDKQAPRQMLAFRAAAAFKSGKQSLSQVLKVHLDDRQIPAEHAFQIHKYLATFGKRSFGRKPIPQQELVDPQAVFLIGNDPKGLSRQELQQWVQRIGNGEDSVAVTKELLASHARQPVVLGKERVNDHEIKMWREIDGQTTAENVLRVNTRDQEQVQAALQTHDQWKQHAQEENAAANATYAQQLEESWDQTRTAIGGTPSKWADIRALQAEERNEPVELDAQAMLELLGE